MTVWSATPYNGEADVLEIRLGTLDGVVDRHVIAEGNRTQRGEFKPLTFLRQKERFAPWLDKISYLPFALEGGEGIQSSWLRERNLRNGLLEGLKDVRDDDLVLLSDVDEVPFPEAIQDYGEPLRLQMDMHMYLLNWRWPERPVRYGTRATLLRGSELGSPAYLVEGGWALSGPAGWHLAYQGDVAEIQRSILSKADELQRYEWLNPEHIALCIDTGKDIFMRDFRCCEWCPDEELPPYALQNRERFAHMFAQQAVAA